MGSTFTSGKHAQSFFAPSGKVFYLISEKTCESNVFPRKPEWSAIGFGDYETVMSRIIGIASNCYSGMLRGSGGAEIKAVNYIKAWRRALNSPSQLKTLKKSVDFVEGDGFYAISSQSRPLIEAVLKRHQLNVEDFISTEKEKSKLTFDLNSPGAAEALSAVMTAPGVVLPAWLLWNQVFFDLESKGPSEKNKKTFASFELDALNDIRLTWIGTNRFDKTIMLSRKTGEVIHMGWPYSIMGMLCNLVRSSVDLRIPCLAEAYLLDFEKKLEDLQECDSGQAFKISLSDSCLTGNHRSSISFAKKLNRESDLLANKFLIVTSNELRLNGLTSDFEWVDPALITVI